MARVLTADTVAEIEKLFPRYPTRLAVLGPAIHLTQRQLGHVSDDAALELAALLGTPVTRVKEMVSFYTMYYDRPVGRHVVRICRNLACQSRGADQVIAKAESVLGVHCGQTTADGRVTLEHEECLAACGTGPALWCDDNLVENLNEDKLEKLLAGLQ
ncbi:MAG: NAD(P)H-dependent oxidoreductase subunit E [Deltaproteobacteria bacterium]|nr:NAD(P)H-dependent oxidoreductase subunit E [Deltaproteobacteria bacterium]